MSFMRLLILTVRLVSTYFLLSSSFVSCLCFTSTVADSAIRTSDNSIPSSNETFMYFAYGSNLLTKRILVQNPTAERRSSAKLKNYRLDFNLQSRDWNGATATVVEDNNYHVWGAIWEIDVSNMAELDRQEGVDRNVYKPMTKNLVTPTGELIECRFYVHVNDPDKFYELEDLPIDRQPSRTYLNCILNGAIESQLPIEYISELYKVPHNNQDANNFAFRQLCDCKRSLLLE